MSEFFLHEAQAQLQLALFGMTPEFMEKTNKPLRDAFANRNPNPTYVIDFCMELIKEMEGDGTFANAYDAAKGGTIKGPLSRSIFSSDESMADKFGNTLIFAFAGHDTTGHTMTWLTYELARHPEYQRRVQNEVDEFFASIGDRPLQYRDCRQLPFLSRCIMETLRLWPAVPNGTYRQLQYDDHVIGPDGEDVRVPKGTFVQILTLPRHHNPDLWGADVLEFNPDRQFSSDEAWNHDPFQAYNPSTDRFSPFTFPPRDCIGKNFAQMEMRTILSHLFYKFDFSLAEAEAEAAANGDIKGVNRGTMGPYDVRNDPNEPHPLEPSLPRVTLGMRMHATPRHTRN
jgi:hypothetical protein